MISGDAASMRVGVLGAGAIGCYVGGRLAAAGHDVVLVGRPRVVDPIAQGGLVLEDLDGSRREARPRCASTTGIGTPEALRDREVVLVTVKAHQLAEAARSLAELPALVIGLQNGVDHPRTLREAIGVRARAGTVSWNVVWKDARTLRRSTSGPVILERHPADPIVDRAIAALRSAGLEAHGADPIEPVLWTKLLFNLNNAANALSSLPLRDQLSMRPWRRVVAAMQREGLAVMRAAGIPPVRIGRLDPRLSARLLPLPDPIFRALAGTMIRIDPAARSSMADDLARGAATEIELLNGAIVREGRARGVPTPVNARVVDAIRARERGSSAAIDPAALL